MPIIKSMIINTTSSNPHWNYFSALENDLEKVSRYIEFAEPNLDVYSIELAHLLFAAASEVDVVAKLLCKLLDDGSSPEKITDYMDILNKLKPEIATTKIFIPRFGLEFTPWENWSKRKSPEWWSSYNKVKHNRDTEFKRANLRNAINSLGGLLIIIYKYYSIKFSNTGKIISPKETMSRLRPQSSIIRLDDSHYYGDVVFGESHWDKDVSS